MILNEDEYLAHYGILRRSGRYPWGSGGPENATNRGFLDYVDHLKKQGLTEKEIATAVGGTISQLRAAKSIAKSEEKEAQIGQIKKLKDKGWSNVAIGQHMNLPESSVRALQVEGVQDKVSALNATAEMLKQQVANKTYIDVGSGVENHIGVSSTMFNNAVALLKEQGYQVHGLQIPQIATGQYTNAKILCPPGTTRSDVFKNRDLIQQVMDFSDDHGRTFLGIHPPLGIDPKRIGINYAENGGTQADGVIYVREGVKDVSLGNSRYAQVRIQVGNSHYLKGMAMYKDNLPDGVDLVFNTNKSDTGNKFDAMKELKMDATGKVDKDNPFGAVIKPGGQIIERDANGKATVSSVMNKVNEEGDWKEWSKNLSSQMLSKQSPSLARAQLNMTYEDRLREFDKISSLTNPTVRRKLLESFGDETTSAAIQLKAAALNTRQASHVILPISSMKPTEIYAPNYNNGERVVLIRHPHAGTFEIPELTVNNNQPEAKRLLKDARDAVGIHHSVAERLSGADFDGDTVIVIPNNNNKVKSSPALDALKGFDPQRLYKLPSNSPIPRMTPKLKQREMGDISNLITDMTIKGASHAELARAVKHSMVVIDAEKHGLNYKQSEIDNGIRLLKLRYQGKTNAGASTLISRAGARIDIPKRTPRPASKGGAIDKTTGERVYVPTGEMRTDAKGNLVPRTFRSKKLAEATDAHALSSGTPMERVYADHSNKLKELANRARLESVNTPPSVWSSSAKRTYAKEVAALDSKLFLAKRNSPLERQAQIIANATVNQKRAANPGMDSETLKKIKNQALAEARLRTGAGKQRITITQSEWDAIQAGAISNSKLEDILANADIDVVRELATPKKQRLMTPTKTNRAKQMLASGYTRAEVAKQLGVSLTTLDLATKEGG